jgi:hypothetical protein
VIHKIYFLFEDTTFNNKIIKALQCKDFRVVRYSNNTLVIKKEAPTVFAAIDFIINELNTISDLTLKSIKWVRDDSYLPIELYKHYKELDKLGFIKIINYWLKFSSKDDILLRINLEDSLFKVKGYKLNPEGEGIICSSYYQFATIEDINNWNYVDLTFN